MSAHASPHTTTTAAAASTRRRRAAIESLPAGGDRDDGGEAQRERARARQRQQQRHEHRDGRGHQPRRARIDRVRQAASTRGMIRRGVLRSGPGGDVSEAERQRHDRPGGEMVAVDERPEGQRALELGPEAPVDIPPGRRRLRDRQERHGKAHRRYGPDRLAHAAAPEERAGDEEERGRASEHDPRPARVGRVDGQRQEGAGRAAAERERAPHRRRMWGQRSRRSTPGEERASARRSPRAPAASAPAGGRVERRQRSPRRLTKRDQHEAADAERGRRRRRASAEGDERPDQEREEEVEKRRAPAVAAHVRRISCCWCRSSSGSDSRSSASSSSGCGRSRRG